MSLRNRPLAVWVSPLVMLLLALLVFSTDAGGLMSRLRGGLFDSYQASRPRAYETTPVRVLDIDEAATMRLGPWPWSHGTLARVLEALKGQGAKIAVLTFPIDRLDPASPKNLLPLVPPGPAFDAARAALSAMPSPDDALAKAMSAMPTVSGFTLGDARPAQTLELKSTTIEIVGKGGAEAGLHAYDQATPVLPAIAAASAGFGALNIADEPGGNDVARRMPLALRLKTALVPSLEAEVLRLYEGKDKQTLQSDDGRGGLVHGRAAIRAAVTAAGEIPTMKDGSVWVAFSGPAAERTVKASDVLGETLKPGALQGTIVYIGAPDDYVQTPRGLMRVAEVHAEAAESLITGKVLRRPATAAGAEMLCLALCGLVLVALFYSQRALWSGGFTILAVAVSFVVSRQLFERNGVLLDAFGISIGLALTYLAGVAARRVEIRGTRHHFQAAFAGSLPQRQIDLLARNPRLLKSEGTSRTVSYLSCGVRGFAELATSFRGDPATFTDLMQRVLEPLMSEAMRRGGAIGKMTGDGFTAFWNAPLDDSEHAIHACEAAVGMTNAIAKVNEIITHERRGDGVALAPVEIGVGISTGPAVTGGITAHGRLVYTVNGDCVVEAEKIQQLSGSYGPAVVVAEDTRKTAERGFAFLEIDTTAFSGNKPAKLFAILGNPVMRASPRFRALATFHEHIFQSLRARQWHKARELILQCRKLSGACQKLYDLHLARIAEYEKSPPPEDWDGVHHPPEQM